MDITVHGDHDQQADLNGRSFDDESASAAPDFAPHPPQSQQGGLPNFHPKADEAAVHGIAVQDIPNSQYDNNVISIHQQQPQIYHGHQMPEAARSYAYGSSNMMLQPDRMLTNVHREIVPLARQSSWPVPPGSHQQIAYGNVGIGISGWNNTQGFTLSTTSSGLVSGSQRFQQVPQAFYPSPALIPPDQNGHYAMQQAQGIYAYPAYSNGPAFVSYPQYPQYGNPQYAMQSVFSMNPTSQAIPQSHSSTTLCPGGKFQSLPVSVMNRIIDELNISSFGAMMRTSRHIHDFLKNNKHYKRIGFIWDSNPKVIQFLRLSEMIEHVTLWDLGVFFTFQCEVCQDLGHLLFTPLMIRVCRWCLETSDRCDVIVRTAASNIFRATDRVFQSIPTVRVPPHTGTGKGHFFMSTSLVEKAAIKYHGSAEEMIRKVTESDSKKLQNYRNKLFEWEEAQRLAVKQGKVNPTDNDNDPATSSKTVKKEKTVPRAGRPRAPKLSTDYADSNVGQREKVTKYFKFVNPENGNTADAYQCKWCNKQLTEAVHPSVKKTLMKVYSPLSKLDDHMNHCVYSKEEDEEENSEEE